MKKTPLDVKLMIFDLDGTLLDSAKDIILSVKAVLKELGYPEKTEEEIASYIGWGSTQLLQGSLGVEDPSIVKKSVDMYWDHYRQHCMDHAKLFPGAKEILEHYKEKKKVIVSNKVREFVEFQLKEMNINDYFAKVVGGDDAKCAKPHPCPILDILKEFKAVPDEAIMIGDMKIDIDAGKAAGVHTCAVTFGIGDRKALLGSDPDFVISDLIELKEIIR